MKLRRGSVVRFTTPLKAIVQRFAFLALVAITFALMMLAKADLLVLERMRSAAADAVAPILGALSRPAATVAELAERARQIANVDAENRRLREENERLLRWQSVARELAAENRSLRELLRFVPPPAASYITARVIADSGGAFVRSMLVAAGSRDGVRRGQAVITGEGLVGRVTQVGERAARVLLITDLNSRIPVVLERSRERAVLAGDNSEQPVLVHLADNAPVAVGERVVTSGHAGVFPPGLPVGVVAEIDGPAIRVQPLIEWSRLEFVRIVEFGTEAILVPDRPAAAR